MKALIVEDQDRLGRFLQQGLTECAYTVCWVRTCADASDALVETNYDVIILDLGLPDGAGLDVCAEIRRWSGAPIIVLSARHAEADKIALLNAA